MSQRCLAKIYSNLRRIWLLCFINMQSDKQNLKPLLSLICFIRYIDCYSCATLCVAVKYELSALYKLLIAESSFVDFRDYPIRAQVRKKNKAQPSRCHSTPKLATACAIFGFPKYEHYNWPAATPTIYIEAASRTAENTRL